MDDHPHNSEAKSNRHQRCAESHLTAVPSNTETNRQGRSPRTIGQLIAHTALLADTAAVRKANYRATNEQRSRFGWFF